MTNDDKDFVERLKKGEEEAFLALYKNFYRMAYQLVVKNTGSEEDAKDIFQEGAIILVHYLRSPDFQLTSKLSTFYYSILRNLWFKELKKRDKVPVEFVDFSEYNKNIDLKDDSIQEYDPQHNQSDMDRLVVQSMGQLSEDCRQLIKWAHIENLTHESIANRLGVQRSYIKVKLFRCMDTLREIIRNTPNFSHLFNSRK